LLKPTIPLASSSHAFETLSAMLAARWVSERMSMTVRSERGSTLADQVNETETETVDRSDLTAPMMIRTALAAMADVYLGAQGQGAAV